MNNLITKDSSSDLSDKDNKSIRPPKKNKKWCNKNKLSSSCPPTVAIANFDDKIQGFTCKHGAIQVAITSNGQSGYLHQMLPLIKSLKAMLVFDDMTVMMVTICTT
jgi:hypothetical protein